MRTDYSKPSTDIQKESFEIFQADKEMLEQQLSVSQTLLACDNRKACLLCGVSLKGESFYQRNIPFIVCETCGHIQTKAKPPEGYPGIEFKTMYPQLNTRDYQDRKERIYKPKLEWIVDCLKDLNYSREEITRLKWFEMGTGAGYFLSSLQDFGVLQFSGLDGDEHLVNIASSVIGNDRIKHYEGSLCDAFGLFPSDAYAAFFVLEHIDDAHRFFLSMRSLPKGTIFVFSVPVFGFSCLLEGAFERNYARHLNVIFHTQLYTDASIAYGLELAGFEMTAEWIFGQDSVDLTRFLLCNLRQNFSEHLLKKAAHDLICLQDSLQRCLDMARKSDQRHIIAVKK